MARRIGRIATDLRPGIRGRHDGNRPSQHSAAAWGDLVNRIIAFFASSTFRGRAWLGLAVAGAALVLTACPGPAAKPPPARGILTSEVAAGVATSGLVDQTLARSLHTLAKPPVESQLEGLAILAGFLALADPNAPPLDPASCVPTLAADADADQDGYPREKTTQTIACQLAAIRIDGTLALLDENDMDPASGFNSELDYRVTVGTEQQTLLSATGDLALWVSSMADGAGYDVYYRGNLAESLGSGENTSRLLYAGTLSGALAAGSLALDGSIGFASEPVDCTTLPESERAACAEQMPEGGAPEGAQLALSSTGIEFDTGGSCPTALTGGHFDVQDDAGNVLRISYAGCGQRSATYNGAALPLVEES